MRVALVALCAAFAAPALAGPMVDVVVGDLTARIVERPADASLYQKRGRAYLARGDVDASLADLDRAIALDPALATAHLDRGHALVRASLLLAAVGAFDRYVDAAPDDPQGYVPRARAYAALSNRAAAERDYDRAIALTRRASPEVYIERARVVAARGPGHVDRALAGLDEGVEALGPVFTLLRAGTDVARDAGRTEVALEWLERLGEAGGRTPAWWVERAELLVVLGRADEAQRAYSEALAAIERLPPRRREMPAVLELAERARAALAVSEPAP